MKHRIKEDLQTNKNSFRVSTKKGNKIEKELKDCIAATEKHTKIEKKQ